jgi:ABC-type branched-subunit amino acid transport system substrate-binding protein
MKRILQILLLVFIAFAGSTDVNGQTKEHQVALLLPLYLDSAYDAADAYRYGKGFPKQSIPALEFYIGAQYALDSLQKEGKKLKVHVIDYKAAAHQPSALSALPLFDSIDLILAPASGSDYLQIATLAQQKNIPFVSATYPNDGGIRNNPNVLIANAKLNTHLQATYNYVLRNHGTSKIFYVRRKNANDDRVAEVFTNLNASSNGPVMKMETVVLNDVMTTADLKAKLDTLRENVILAGSLDENFGRNLLMAASTLPKNIKLTIVGMPTWESIRELSKSEVRALPIIHSTSFFNNPAVPLGMNFEDAYRKRTYSRPTDVAFKGYELTWTFVNLLLKYDDQLMKHLDDESFNLVTDYDFKPITWSKGSATPDYYENKRVYLVKRLNGVVTRVN